MPNPNGHPETLRRAPEGNTLAPKHGVYSDRALEPRAREIAERVIEAPHTVELDEIGAAEIGRLEALVEAIDVHLADHGLAGKRGWRSDLIDLLGGSPNGSTATA